MDREGRGIVLLGIKHIQYSAIVGYNALRTQQSRSKLKPNKQRQTMQAFGRADESSDVVG